MKLQQDNPLVKFKHSKGVPWKWLAYKLDYCDDSIFRLARGEMRPSDDKLELISQLLYQPVDDLRAWWDHHYIPRKQVRNATQT